MDFNWQKGGVNFALLSLKLHCRNPLGHSDSSSSVTGECHCNKFERKRTKIDRDMEFLRSHLIQWNPLNSMGAFRGPIFGVIRVIGGIV